MTKTLHELALRITDPAWGAVVVIVTTLNCIGQMTTAHRTIRVLDLATRITGWTSYGDAALTGTTYPVGRKSRHLRRLPRRCWPTRIAEVLHQFGNVRRDFVRAAVVEVMVARRRPIHPAFLKLFAGVTTATFNYGLIQIIYDNLGLAGHDFHRRAVVLHDSYVERSRVRCGRGREEDQLRPRPRKLSLDGGQIGRVFGQGNVQEFLVV